MRKAVQYDRQSCCEGWKPKSLFTSTHRPWREACGSISLQPTSIDALHGSRGDVAELADALDLGSSSFTECRFDSCHPHSLDDLPHCRRRRTSFRPDTPIETAPGDTADSLTSMPQLSSAAGGPVPCLGRRILCQERNTNPKQRCFPWWRVMIRHNSRWPLRPVRQLPILWRSYRPSGLVDKGCPSQLVPGRSRR